jgi:NADPH:quinone reductase-like Zn-dependent oxidoreductase
VPITLRARRFLHRRAQPIQLAMPTGLIDAGKLQPVVGAVFPIAKARQAYEHKPTRGKVVLEVAV